LINLFADDTTIYLGQEDRYNDLQDILSQWCTISGAKFNSTKMEIIPTGPTDHRARVLMTCQLHPDDEPLHTSIQIAPDGQAVHSLRAWIGNKIDNMMPWEPILDKINTHLNWWSLGHPTLDGKQLIVQMVVGASTQYLRKVHGMPTRIEEALVKTIRNFVWNENIPQIGLQYLY
ncbi:hypothetical protein HETIRDRAFT_242409, partial [Heterobasidion irregulare TC 32-1]